MVQARTQDKRTRKEKQVLIIKRLIELPEKLLSLMQTQGSDTKSDSINT